MPLSVAQMATMSRLLDDALPLDAAGRERWLAQLPAEHADLAPTLREALLPTPEDEPALKRLDTLPKIGSAPEATLSAVHPGERVGPYELIRLLGSGGMAEVWLAQRVDGAFKREVALKLPMLWRVRADLAQRFAREREILAGLEHANIARLYDAGVSAEGMPYLALEYVQGKPLTEWCDEHRLGLRERLKLFLQVLDAVQYAHGHHVVHRDLKPSNILVTEAGQVRLLDFGVAKLLATDAQSDQIELTRIYGRVLTLEYASPEQLRAEPVDATSDIYSLGVLLYELLTGSRPYRVKPGATPAQLEQAIMSADIDRPSDCVRADAGQARATTTGKIVHRLRGDLDAIAVKAMARSPSGRYQNASALADDLQRHLSGEPVEARPDRFVYRMSRLVLRHRVGTAATAAVIAIGVGAGVAVYRGAATRSAADQAPVAASASPPMASTSKMLPDRPSLAVLPFDSHGGSSENSYFADGMTDDIITDLSKLSGILVVARNSSSTYKGKSVKVQQVGKELGVRYVLQGSVRREGDTVRINAQLVDALGGQHLWADRYDGSIRDVFALQDKVVGQIVAALAVNLTRDEQRRVGIAETRSPQAYDAVLRGWAHYRQSSEDEIKKAIALFEQAIALDPEYARAHAAVAAASWRLVQSDWESTTQGRFQRAFDRMQAALVNAMRQPNALAHAVSAEFLSKQGRYAEAFTEIGKAMALAPNDPDNYLSKARILNATGRAAEAEEAVRWAMRLDPLYSPEYLRVLSISLFHQQRYEEAVGTLERLLALKTDVPDDYITLIASLGHLGRSNGIPQAIETFNTLSVQAGQNTISVQMWGGWWWHGDIFNYDAAYRDRLMQGLRKAGVPEGAGTDIPFEKYRGLLQSSEGYFSVTGATTIDPKQAKALHDRGVKFVDVRAAKGFASGHVPGAFNLDVGTELSRDSLSRIVAKNEEFVLSCHGKTCADSAYASAKAVIWGFKRVYYFSAGFPAWEEAGYPVEVSPTR